jgi:sugar phosphate isomerase/epimerase
MAAVPRSGEAAPANGGVAAVEHAVALGCDVVALQTLFLHGDGAERAALRRAAAGRALVLCWGHPEGLAFGRRPHAEADLVAWLDVAAALGAGLVRIVVGGPALRGAEPVAAQLARVAPVVRRCADAATRRGLDLAIENHGDLTTVELTELVCAVDAPNVGVCLDSSNALRLGEDVVPACAAIAPLVRMVHLKDVEAPAEAIDQVAGPCSVPYGEGVMPLAEIVDALAAPIAAGAPVCLEIGQVRPGDDELELLESGVAWVRAAG